MVESSSLKFPKAVLFDWDNTLVDTWPIIHQALAVAFVKMGREPWTLEEAKEKVGKSMRDAFPLLFGDRWEEAAALYRASYAEVHLDHVEAYVGAESTVRQLIDAGVYVALVSNKMGDTLRKEVEHLGWNDLFQAAVGATDAAHDKPHPAPVYLALKTGMIEASKDVWFVGDSEVDLEVALAAGLTPVLYGDVVTDADKEKHFRGFPFEHHARDHKEFMQLFA